MDLISCVLGSRVDLACYRVLPSFTGLYGMPMEMDRFFSQSGGCYVFQMSFIASYLDFA